MKLLNRLSALVLLSSMVPVAAWAHPGHDGHDFTWDFSSGFLHPFTGWDHLAAMAAVGIWAALAGGRARWLLPVSFLVSMTAGAGIAGSFAIPGTEQAIAASLFVLGLLVAGAIRLPLASGIALTAAFAFFHGVAHGAEAPSGSTAATFGIGFLMATALLHGMGLLLGGALRSDPRLRQIAGAGVAAAGILAIVASG